MRRFGKRLGLPRVNVFRVGARSVISNDQELATTLERIQCLRQQVKKLRQVEANPQNYRLSAGGYLAEIDRMNLEVREYFTLHPTEISQAA
jgi:hypothetical protein